MARQLLPRCSRARCAAADYAYARFFEDAKEILAAAQPSGAAALAAPGGTTGAEGVTRPPWEGLELVASSSAKRDEELNHWEEWFKKDEKPYQTL